KDVESDANYQTITRHAFGNKYQPHLRRRLTAPSVSVDSSMAVNSNNLAGIFTIEELNAAKGIKSSSPLSYATVRQRNNTQYRNTIGHDPKSRYSLWPSDDPDLPADLRRRGSSKRSLQLDT